MGPVEQRPVGLKDILLLGLLAGGPTVLGTMISGYGVSPYLSVAFYTLAAGSLLYVIVSLGALSYTVEQLLQTATGMFIGIGLMYTTGMALSLLIGAKA